MGISIPTRREAPREGWRGLVPGWLEAGEMLGRQREVRSGSVLSLGAVTHSSADLESCKGATN